MTAEQAPAKEFADLEAPVEEQEDVFAASNPAQGLLHAMVEELIDTATTRRDYEKHNSITSGRSRQLSGREDGLAYGVALVLAHHYGQDHEDVMLKVQVLVHQAFDHLAKDKVDLVINGDEEAGIAGLLTQR